MSREITIQLLNERRLARGEKYAIKAYYDGDEFDWEWFSIGA